VAAACDAPTAFLAAGCVQPFLGWLLPPDGGEEPES